MLHVEPWSYDLDSEEIRVTAPCQIPFDQMMKMCLGARSMTGCEPSTHDYERALAELALMREHCRALQFKIDQAAKVLRSPTTTTFTVTEVDL